MYLKRFYDQGLAQASYIVGCQKSGEAIVIDPAREISEYIQTADQENLKIVAVTETHIHADYLSGTRQLAHQTGAKMYLSGEGGPDWQYQFAQDSDQIVFDGDIIKIGNLTLKVLHTPGHTPEHISFLLTDHPATSEPIGAFTGDFLFVGDVGRPDLLEKAAGLKDTMRKGAVELYQSLQKFSKLPKHLQIWPAHGAGSACGKALGAVPGSVLGYELIANWAFQCQTEEEFVEQILTGQPEPPHYFAKMKHFNKVGPALLDGTSPPQLGVEDLVKAQKDSLIVDLRGADQYVESHLPGSVFLPANSSLATWAGWLLSYDEPIYLLIGDGHDVKPYLKSLESIGLDVTRGYFEQETLQQSGLETQSSTRISAEDFQRESSDQTVIDVRSSAEWQEGHYREARHIHLGELTRNLDKVPESPLLYCRSGTRSLMASSLLERAGKNPRDILGGYLALDKQKDLVTK